MSKEYMKESESLGYTITPKGSLGLLAYGDMGLRAWREVRREQANSKSNEEE